MGRRNVIDGLVSQIQQTNGFDANSPGTAVAYDHRVVASGVERAAVVLAERGTQAVFAEGLLTEMTWLLDVQVFIRHSTDIVTARQDADIYVQNIINQINSNPTLGGSAFDAMVTQTQVLDEKFVVGQVPYLLESLTVSAKEHLSG